MYKFVTVQKARKVRRGKPGLPTPAKREAFLRQAEKAIKVSFIDGVTRFKKRIPKAKLDAMYAAKDYSGLSRSIPWHELVPGLEPVNQHLQKVIEGSVAQALKDIGVEGLSASEVEASQQINLRHQRVLENTAERRQLQLLDLSEAQPKIDAAVAEGYRAGRSPRMVASEIHNSMVLTKGQSDALVAYQRGLEAAGKHSAKQIEKLVQRRHDKLLAYRAETIAITETRIAAVTAENAVWQQQAQDGLISQDSTRLWQAEPDCCVATCAQMHGKSIALGEQWQLPNGNFVPYCNQAHPRCRCVEVLITPDA